MMQRCFHTLAVASAVACSFDLHELNGTGGPLQDGEGDASTYDAREDSGEREVDGGVGGSAGASSGGAHMGGAAMGGRLMGGTLMGGATMGGSPPGTGGLPGRETGWVLLTGGLQPSEQPEKRYNHAAAYDPDTHRMYVYGGWSGLDYLSALAYWDVGGGKWVKITDSGNSPLARSQHAATFDTARRRLLVYGGILHDNLYQDDSWNFDGQTWSQISGLRAGRRVGSSLVYDRNGQRAYLYGGRDGSRFRSVFSFDGQTWTLEPIAANAPALSSHAAAWDSHRGRMIIHGGTTEPGNSIKPDLWEWEPTTSAWTRLEASGPSPPGRYDAAMVYDSSRRALFLFGGATGSGDSNELWRWTAGSGWTDLTPNPIPATWPTPRRNHTMVYEESQGRLLVYGGETPLTVNELWAYVAP